MTSTDASVDAAADPLPGLRRVVTWHRADGVAVVKSDEVVPSREAGETFPGVRVGPLWATGPLPVDDNNEETDGATRKPDGDLGLVMRGGTNVQYTDLAPGASAPADLLVGPQHPECVSTL
ncbi:hypothetical protein OH77DRAFT_1516495 [Trametes cingulata]|nr:hypothetical protein OH77DRAFT_1516495 [Trametes cingulata]